MRRKEREGGREGGRHKKRDDPQDCALQMKTEQLSVDSLRTIFQFSLTCILVVEWVQ